MRGSDTRNGPARHFWNQVRCRMCDAGVERREAPAALCREFGEIDVGGVARGFDDRTIKRAAVARDEERRLVAKEFRKRLTSIFHREPDRAGDAEKA